jgi:hypothetical protein
MHRRQDKLELQCSTFVLIRLVLLAEHDVHDAVHCTGCGFAAHMRRTQCNCVPGTRPLDIYDEAPLGAHCGQAALGCWWHQISEIRYFWVLRCSCTGKVLSNIEKLHDSRVTCYCLNLAGACRTLDLSHLATDV